ncbi:mitochondrial 2-oxodicarboxylate carrier 1 [Glomus cerebriforme]|uniref:Mitochondrial 2-oxodicarboxylate carrier 1 n=1 Tax=Glomus cerebriforme TaxID=658196 RepID=A0A397SQY2_9GLOM|nr:mitochondrial 2-oxodicarboxylate carrier 1 [Glomus cerebriforme]
MAAPTAPITPVTPVIPVTTAAPEKPLPFLFHFTAGGIAGTSEILVMYPLDVVKTRFQLQVSGAGGETYTSIADCFKKIIKNEGFSRLYRGILPPILVEAPKRAIKFSANEQYSTLLKKIYGVDKMNQSLSIQAGISAGCTEAVVIVPFELVKIRLQDKESAGKYNGTFDAITKIIRHEGPFALYNGLEATVWRHATWNGGYFGVIFTIRKSLPKAENKQQQLRNNFIAGAVGGTVGTIINTPFDVVKTRIQNDSGIVKKYNWTLPAVATVAKEEGIKALYKGFVPKVLRLGPGGGILLVVFDQVTKWMKKYLL